MHRYALLASLVSLTAVAQTPPDTVYIDRLTQAKRDDVRHKLLERELENERALLLQAQRKLAGAETGRTPAETIGELQETVRRHVSNIAALRDEISYARGGIVRVDAKSGGASGRDTVNSQTQQGIEQQPQPSPGSMELLGAKPTLTLKNSRREAVRLQGNPRLVVFPYDRNNTYPIHLMEGLNTHLEFPEGEHVKTLSVSNCGQDSPFWTCSISEDRRHIWIKPKASDLTNVGTIVTNRRVYEISLHAVVAGRDWYQRVTWDGGWQDQGFFEFRDPLDGSGKPTKDSTARSSDLPPAENGVGPEKLRFGYSIDGDAPFRPQTVFDDGKFTWIKLGTNVQELPALFVLAGDDVELVNYSQRGDYLLVNRLVPGLLLKLGKAEVRVRSPGHSR